MCLHPLLTSSLEADTLVAGASCSAAPLPWIGHFPRAQVAAGLQLAGASELCRTLFATPVLVSKMSQYHALVWATPIANDWRTENYTLHVLGHRGHIEYFTFESLSPSDHQAEPS